MPSTTVPPRMTMSACMHPSSQPPRPVARAMAGSRPGSDTVDSGRTGLELTGRVENAVGVGGGLEGAWRFGFSGPRRRRRPTTRCRSPGAIVAPSDGPSPVELVDAGPRPARPRGGAGPVRAQDPQEPDHPDGPQLHDGGGPAAALRRLRQRRRPRARRPGLAPDLGGQHPRLLRRRRHVLARERPAGRAAGLAGHQPEPARLRRQRPARVAGRLHGEPGQPGHGHRAQGRRRARRPARPLHGRRGRRAVRPRPPAADARRDLPRRRQHAGLEGPPRHPPRRCSRRSCPTWRPWST